MFGILGSLSLSMYSIYTKKALPHVNQEIWLLSYYNNFYSSILFLPLIILNGELSAIITYEHLFSWWFILAMTVGGICGFAIGFVTALQIKVNFLLRFLSHLIIIIQLTGDITVNAQHFRYGQGLCTDCNRYTVV